MPFSLSDITATVGASNPSQPTTPSGMQARRAAVEFEALLLSQLTASLNPAESEEGALFGGESGSGMYRQMFSEQIATAMAQSGGIGLADLMLGQIQGKPAHAKVNTETNKAFTAARTIKNAPSENSKPTAPVSSHAVSNVNRAKHNNVSPYNSATETDLYPKAIIISEASDAESPSTDSGTVLPSINVAASASTMNDEMAETLPLTSVGNSSMTPAEAATATRPRRVFALPKAESAANATFNSPLPASLTPVAQVALRTPINGALRSTFGPRVDPINGKHRFHKGIDLAAPRGTPIGAAAEGQVVFAGRNGGYGNMVILKHADGRVTRYGHAERLYVTRGDVVKAGQTIAAVGSTGHSTGPHLHFEVFERGTPVNPLRVLVNDATLRRR